MRPAVVSLLAVVLTLAALPARADGASTILLPDDGPTVPGAGLPVATVPAIVHFLHSGDAPHAEVAQMPTVAWTRALLVFHSAPNGDPWDRTFRVGIGDTEVLHGTTPRGDFTVTQDITEYGSLLRGANASVWTWVDSWVCCGIYVDVTLELYDDATAAAQPRHEAALVASPFRVAGLGGPGSVIDTTYDFGAVAPSRGIVEMITTGHTQDGEFWYQNADTTTDTPNFSIYVDGQIVGKVRALPYVYALIGFSGGSTAQTINQELWGPAVQAQEAAGVHAVSGKTPSYRAQIPAEILPLLQGARDVKIVKETHGGSWPTSLNFLLD